MKPVEHPEFFRFPAPRGRSRESSIRLDSQGRFWHDNERVERPGMNRAFSCWIRRHPDNGRYILENGYDWTYFTVDDVPFFVTSLTCDAQSDQDEVTITLSDGSNEALQLGTLAEGENNALYCAVKQGEFSARFMPHTQTALAPLLEEHPQGYAIRMNSRVFPIGKRTTPSV